MVLWIPLIALALATQLVRFLIPIVCQIIKHTINHTHNFQRYLGQSFTSTVVIVATGMVTASIAPVVGDMMPTANDGEVVEILSHYDYIFDPTLIVLASEGAQA